MPRPLKLGTVCAGTIILPENIHKNVGKVTLIFADSHVRWNHYPTLEEFLKQMTLLSNS